MIYFQHCKTIAEIKSLYRSLAMKNHPDKGGKTEIMQAINSEYAFACANILTSNSDANPSDTEEEILKAEKYREALEKIISLDGIIIELVGNWIWITGNTYPHRAILKHSGYMFAHKKVAWYFRTDEFKTRNRQQLSLDEIKRKYGSKDLSGRMKTIN